VILVGWQHPFYTAFTGIGLALARLNKNWLIKIMAPLLGLAVAQHIVMQHGGSMKIESTPGQGTTVTVTLPA